MRTPPPLRTWGEPPAEIVIRQSAPILADEFFESYSWRGMELVGGWLIPKGVGLSNEEKELDQELCGRADENLEGYLAGIVDYLPIINKREKRQREVGYTVISVSHPNETFEEELERWFGFGYCQVWIFCPWHRALDVYTSPSHREQVRGEMFQSPYLGSPKRPGKLPLSEIWEDLT